MAKLKTCIVSLYILFRMLFWFIIIPGGPKNFLNYNA